MHRYIGLLCLVLVTLFSISQGIISKVQSNCGLTKNDINYLKAVYFMSLFLLLGLGAYGVIYRTQNGLPYDVIYGIIIVALFVGCVMGLTISFKLSTNGNMCTLSSSQYNTLYVANILSILAYASLIYLFVKDLSIDDCLNSFKSDLVRVGIAPSSSVPSKPEAGIGFSP